MPAKRRTGQMLQVGPNRWRVKVYTGKSPTGKNTYAIETLDGTTSEARKALTALLASVDTKNYIRPSSLSLSVYLDEWLKGKIDVSARTNVSYGRMLGYARTHIGNMKLGQIEALDVQRFLGKLTELSPRTIEYIHRCLHSAFQSAVKAGTLLRNPAEFATLPKKSKRQPSVFSVEQMNLFLEITADYSLYPLWLLLLSSGLRPAEACALQWSDLDTTEGWVTVMRVIEDDGHGKQTISNNVKADSRRRIGLPKTTIEALSKHRKAQAAEILAAGKKYNRQSYVFANTEGGLLDLHHVRKVWKLDLAAVNAKRKSEEKPILPIIRLYDCRHTHLTALLANGADLGWVSSRAGHSDIKMTRDHYAHVLPETHREMGQMTERLLKRTTNG